MLNIFMSNDDGDDGGWTDMKYCDTSVSSSSHRILRLTRRAEIFHWHPFRFLFPIVQTLQCQANDRQEFILRKKWFTNLGHLSMLLWFNGRLGGGGEGGALPNLSFNDVSARARGGSLWSSVTSNLVDWLTRYSLHFTSFWRTSKVCHQ